MSHFDKSLQLYWQVTLLRLFSKKSNSMSWTYETIQTILKCSKIFTHIIYDYYLYVSFNLFFNTDITVKLSWNRSVHTFFTMCQKYVQFMELCNERNYNRNRTRRLILSQCDCYATGVILNVNTQNWVLIPTIRLIVYFCLFYLSLFWISIKYLTLEVKQITTD